jgi:hypothetical protein
MLIFLKVHIDVQTKLAGVLGWFHCYSEAIEVHEVILKEAH